jgi:hypothetical protein
MTDSREIDIRVARALGFKVKRGALYAPEPHPTLIGGNTHVHLGSAPETPEIIEDVWQTYSPRFSSDVNEAFWLLERLWNTHGIEYNLFRDNGDWHTCELGYWAHDEGERDELWQATEKEPALAIAKAVAQCPVVMGEGADVD